ncbi:hypothetical protein BD770DRAFT_419739 [Pilaira anomala]|nr:hypothetical protein BD770DRAFT_419739 [Pilaira anomala]
MIAPEGLSTLSFSNKENNRTVLLDQFLKEALLILKHADISFCDNSIQDEAVVKTEQEDAVTWKLKLTPTMMTLETRIVTISELEKVLEAIRTNVKPEPPKFRDKKRVNSDGFDITYFRQLIEPVLKLSTVASIPPRQDQLSQQYNSMQLIRHCVQNFIDCGYSFFIDVPSLIANTDMILSQPGAAKKYKIETLLILSICTLMIRHTTIHHRGNLNISNSLMHTYYSQARQLLQDLFDVHDILVVQSMFILSLFPQDHLHLFSPSRIKSPLLSIAIRMGLAMDLHLLDEQQHDFNECEKKEKLRRFAWMLLCSDYYSNWNATGNHGFILVEDWHVDFPQPIFPEENNMIKKIEFFSQYCRITVIRKLELFKSAYMISLQSTKALKAGLDSQLFKTYFNTPDMFKLNLDNPTQTYSKNDLEALLLHELYCHTQLFAQLPFLPSKYFQDFLLQDPSSPSHPISYDQQQQQQQRETINMTTDLDPVYGAIITIHLYLIIEKACPYNEIRSICQINLMRSYRILRQASSIYADPAIQYSERMLMRHNVISEEDTPICTLNKRAYEIIRSLQTKSSFVKEEEE